MVLPEYLMRFEPAPAGKQAVDERDWGKRSKLGGVPTWIQRDETPDCPACGQEMTFLAQIDSIDYSEDETEPYYMFGDVGMVYVFYCGECHEAAAFEQSG
jgi:uncharacterized protein YwqG